MDLTLNAKRFSGKEYTQMYHDFRPDPPITIIQQSLNYLNQAKAELVIDMGSGTGLSTGIWTDFTEKIIGIEPGEDMIRLADQNNKSTKINYRQAYAHDTGLEEGIVDIISCSQSFHWMEPKTTLVEVSRLLKPGGVLVIFDVVWPPEVNSFYEQAYNDLFNRVEELTAEIDKPMAHKWNKDNHFPNVQSSGLFQFTKESYYHKIEVFNKERFINLALSQGGIQALLRRGYSEEETGWAKFKNIIESLDPPISKTMTFNYRVIYGVK